MVASARNLLLSNAATVLAALFFHWDVGQLLWPYWIQSVIVGWYARKRIANLPDDGAGRAASRERTDSEEESGTLSFGSFFALHYGFFHLLYAGFLHEMHPVAGLGEGLALAACGVSFALSQRATYLVQHAADLRSPPAVAALMALPYLRVVPMHLAILAGSAFSGAGALLFFAALKTAADVLLDWFDRRIAERTRMPKE